MRIVLERAAGEPANVLAAARELVTAAGVGGMVGGQYIEVAGQDGARLRRLHELKTGRLIAASVGVRARSEGLSGPATIPSRRFAAELGVVFQIVDDILDVTGDEAELGQAAGVRRTAWKGHLRERARARAGPETRR